MAKNRNNTFGRKTEDKSKSNEIKPAENKSKTGNNHQEICNCASMKKGALKCSNLNGKTCKRGNTEKRCPHK